MSISLARWETGGIAILVGGCALLRGRFPLKIELGEALLLAAVLLLVQGLVRDLGRLRAARAAAKSASPPVTCVCAESTFGITGIVIGALLVFGTSPIVIRVPALAWPIAIGVVALFGFFTRHLVVDWGMRRLRWEPDHAGKVVLRRR